MREADVGTHLEPLLGLVVGTHAGGKTVVERTLDDTVVTEVAEAAVELEAVGTAGDGDVVFLTEAVDESFLSPVVGDDIVCSVVVAEGGGGIELAVGTDQLLSWQRPEPGGNNNRCAGTGKPFLYRERDP